MDLVQHLSTTGVDPALTVVEMHTSGEPTRIVIQGYPRLVGPLLQQRQQALAQHDHIRRRLMLEPRGHVDMYGAILRPVTEHTEADEADIGVLFTTNNGYSTMCGHATIALGRLLVDTKDLDVFPKRNSVKAELESRQAKLKLHAPCGIVDVRVPLDETGKKSDPNRPVSFVGVESFATGIHVNVDLPEEFKWDELKVSGRSGVNVDFCYGGAFYCVVDAEELGFGKGLRKGHIDLDSMNKVTRLLKAAVNAQAGLKRFFNHPDHDDLGFLYAIMIVDRKTGIPAAGSLGAETGLCFFADQQIDRSPTGSAVAARVALAFAKHELKIGDTWTYHSLVSNAMGTGAAGFVGRLVEVKELSNDNSAQYPFARVRVEVEGYAYYVGTHTFIAEAEDTLGRNGFSLRDVV